jgi:uncharacterized protein
MRYEAAKVEILDLLENNLPNTLYYHGVHHTLDVLAVVENLCQQEGIEKKEAILVKTAALLHDSGFVKSLQHHEEYSCELTNEILPKYGYSPTDILRVCSMIFATKIPQTPQNHLEKILCDADLDYLGRNDFPSIAQTLFQEMRTLGFINTLAEWNLIQINFLKSHQFFTQSSRLYRQSIQDQHLEELKQIVEHTS